MTPIHLTIHECKQVIELIEQRCLPDVSVQFLLHNLRSLLYYAEEGGKPDEIPPKIMGEE